MLTLQRLISTKCSNTQDLAAFECKIVNLGLAIFSTLQSRKKLTEQRKESGNIGQGQKPFILKQNIYFWKGDWALGSISTQVRDFPNIS